jgi:hypothetical protein
MDDENTKDATMGRKIFFLYPSLIMVQGVIEELIQQEYEIYIVRNHKKLQGALKIFPGSILFANIDEGMPVEDWEVWIQGIMQDPATANVQIGILTATANETLEEKYTNQVQVQCGFIVVKNNILSAFQRFHSILQSLDARGQRKYIRVSLEGITTKIKFPYNGLLIKGTIKDISVVGLSCSFDEDPGLEKNALCHHMQIKLGIDLFKAEGVVFGSRGEKSSKVYVLLFTQRTGSDVRTRIRKFNQSILQSRMSVLLQ